MLRLTLDPLSQNRPEQAGINMGLRYTTPPGVSIFDTPVTNETHHPVSSLWPSGSVVSQTLCSIGCR